MAEIELGRMNGYEKALICFFILLSCLFFHYVGTKRLCWSNAFPVDCHSTLFDSSQFFQAELCTFLFVPDLRYAMSHQMELQ